MKNKFFCFLLLIAGLLFISGCGNNNFFDVQSAMNPPGLSQEQKKIKSVIEQHFSEDFTWEYPLIDGKYSPATVVNLTNDNEIHQLIFCRVSGEAQKVHMLLLKQNQSEWEVVEDITCDASNIEKVYVQDIDNDNLNEIVISSKKYEDSYNSIYAYKYDKGHLLQVKVPSNFFDGISE